MVDWEKDEEKKYLWRHKEQPIEVMHFTNNDMTDLQCVYVRFLNAEEWLSNYFLYNIKDQDIQPLDFALEMVERFKKEEKNEEKI